MDTDEIVEEECMALEAIFMDSFSKLDARKVRMVVDPPDDGCEDLKGWSIVVEMTLPDGYPECVPEFDLSNPNNAAFNASSRKEIITGLSAEANSQLGEQMVYNLVEWLREKLPTFVELCKSERVGGSGGGTQHLNEPEEAGNIEVKKEKMTKAQKRRHYNRYGAVEEKPRGWDWIDIMSHLSKKPPPPTGVV